MDKERNIAAVRTAFDAYVAKDRAAIEAVMAEDLRFTSPYDNRIDRKTYFERCWPNSEQSAGFEFIHLAADGDQVFVTYEGRSKNGHKGRNTEVFTVRDGKITEVEVYFGWNVPHEAAPGGFVNP